MTDSPDPTGVPVLASEESALIALAESVLARLRSSVWLLLEDLPTDAKSVRGLSAWSGVSHAVCQRAIAGCRPGLDPFEVLAELPGPEGLAKLLDATRERLPNSPHLGEAAAAYKAYLNLLESFHGRRRGLSQALRRTPASLRAESARSRALTESRERMFEASLHMSRCWADCMFTCRVVRLGQDGQINQYLGLGWRRLHRQPGHMAMILCWIPSNASKPLEPPTCDLFEGPLPASGAILRAFSSSPLPSLVSRDMGDYTIWLIDPELATDAPLDLTLAFPFEFAADSHEPFLSAMSPRIPARRLVMDTYFHRETIQVRAMEPVLTLTHSAGGQNRNLAERWYDALPFEVRPERIGTASAADPPEAFLAMRPLARDLIHRLGDAPGDYVGYRVEVPFPMWGQQHSVQFDLNYTKPRG